MPHINHRRLDGKGLARWAGSNRKVARVEVRKAEPRRVIIAKAITESRG